MNIYLINGKPHTSVSNGFQLISDYDYCMMLEQGVEPSLEVIDND
ncbi:hypothetical protein MEZE111188_05865 [Mesobacillus zeae]